MEVHFIRFLFDAAALCGFQAATRYHGSGSRNEVSTFPDLWGPHQAAMEARVGHGLYPGSGAEEGSSAWW